MWMLFDLHSRIMRYFVKYILSPVAIRIVHVSRALIITFTISVTPPNGAWTETRVWGHDVIAYIAQDQVAAAIVASPTGVLDLDVHYTSETDPFKDLSSLVHAPAAPIISPFFHSSDSSEASEDSSSGDSFESLSSLDSHEIVPAPPGVSRRPAILVLPGQEIPFS
ncbi:hypothetical protein Tco_1102326 [Tanacetum coccineum]